MSYMLLDKVGYVGDLASARGLRQLYEAAAGRPAALKFIESGEIESEDEKERLLSEVDGDPRWNHVRAMLSNGQAPFVITDGASSSAEGEVANAFDPNQARDDGGRWTSGGDFTKVAAGQAGAQTLRRAWGKVIKQQDAARAARKAGVPDKPNMTAQKRIWGAVGKAYRKNLEERPCEIPTPVWTSGGPRG